MHRTGETLNKDYIAFFDLDHTILNTNSGKIMGIAAFREGIIKKQKFIEGVIYGLGSKLGLVEGDTIMPRLVKWLNGHPEQYIVDFARQVFNEVLKYTIRKEAIQEIEFHRNNNAHLVMLSASVNFICKPVIEFLGLDDLICTDPHVINHRFSGHTQGGVCFGEEKLVRSRSFIQTHGLSLHDAFFYTDSFTDLPMLEAVGNPVAVTPVRKLAAVARSRGWQIYNW